MGRIWVLALGMILGQWALFALGDIGGTEELLLTAAGPMGAGVVAAFLVGGSYFSRAIWLLVGVIAGALGYLIGAGVLTDNAFGLALGASITSTILAILTFWTRKEASFLCGLLGWGALGGVYSFAFNTDPQSINVSLPIGMGMTILPLAFGYLAGMLIRILLPDDQEYQEIRDAKRPGDDSSGDSADVDGTTDAADTEVTDTSEISDSDSNVDLEKNASNA